MPNRAPMVVGEIAPQTAFPGDTVAVDVATAFRDPDGDALTFTAVASDSSVVGVSVSESHVTMVGLSRGSAVVTVTARDPAGGEAGQSFEVTVPNRVPAVAEAIGPRTVFLGESAVVDLSGAFSDPDGDSLTFEATSSDTTVVRVRVSESEATLETASRGSAVVTVTARDPHGAEAGQSFEVTVPNRVPAVAEAIGPRTVFLGESAVVDLSGAFSDPDGDSLTFEATSSDTTVVRVRVSESEATLETASRGVATVTVTARDPHGAEAGQSFEVTVPNRVPAVAEAIGPRTVFLGESAVVDLSGAFSDPDGDALTFEATSSDTTVVRVRVSESEATLETASRGVATVTVTARDPAGGEAGQSFEVTVPNRVPAVAEAIGPRTVFLGESAVVDLSGAFGDPDGDSLTFEATSSDTTVVRVRVSESEATLETASRGVATVTVTARDPAGGEAGQSFEVTVPNRVPAVAEAIGPRTVFLGESAVVDLSGAFSDPDGDALTFRASSSDTSVVTAAVAAAALTVQGVSKGTATVTVTARDGHGGEVAQSMIVTVPNRSPVTTGSIPAQTVAEGETTTVDVSPYFRDPDDDSLGFGAFSSNAAYAGVSVSGSAVTIEGVAAGSASVTVTARDPDGGEARQSFGVTVRQSPPPNQAPVVVRAIPAQIVAEGESVSVTLDDYFSDPEGGSLNYGATSSNEGVATTSISGSAVVVEGVSEGTATVTVTATDPGGLSARQQFGVTVGRAPGNRAPEVVQGISDRTLAVGKSFGGPAGPYFRDPDNDSLLYTATSSNPAAVTVTTAHLPLFPPVFEVRAVTEGTAIITLTATDPEDLSVSLTFQVTAEILPNNPPVATQDLPDQTINVGQERAVVRNLHDYFSDPDGDRLGFSASSSDTSVLETGWSIVSGWWINGRSAGTVTVTVTATDEVGASVSQDVTVTVVELPNEAPIVTGAIPNQSMVVGETDSLSVGDLHGYFSDPDDDPLTFRASSSARGTVSVWIQETSLYMRAFLAGSVTVTVTATDPGLKNVSQEFTVTAEPEGSTNQAPVVTGTIADRTAIIGGELPVQTYRYFTDPDGDDANLDYTVGTSNTAVATVRQTSEAVFRVTAVSNGSAAITVTAQDPGGLTASVSFTFTVGNNAPRVKAAAPAVTSSPGEVDTLVFTSHFEETDVGDELRYSASSTNSGVASASVKFDPISGFIVEITGVAAGEATISMTATDRGGLSATTSSLVTVNANLPPQVTQSIGNQSLAVNDTLTWDLSQHFSDNDALTYTAAGGFAVTVSVSGATFQLVGATAGVSPVRVTATDPSGREAEITFLAFVRTAQSLDDLAASNPPGPRPDAIPERWIRSTAHAVSGDTRLTWKPARTSSGDRRQQDRVAGESRKPDLPEGASCAKHGRNG